MWWGYVALITNWTQQQNHALMGGLEEKSPPPSAGPNPSAHEVLCFPFTILYRPIIDLTKVSLAFADISMVFACFPKKYI